MSATPPLLDPGQTVTPSKHQSGARAVVVILLNLAIVRSETAVRRAVSVQMSDEFMCKAFSTAANISSATNGFCGTATAPKR